MELNTQDSLGRQDIITQRHEMADFAVRKTAQEITDTDAFTPELASKLGGNFVSYELQRRFHGVDQLDDLAEEGDQRSKMSQEIGKVIERQQTAVTDAMHGRWDGIKEELTRHAELQESRASDPGPIESDDLKAEKMKEAEHFRMLSDSISNSGPALKPPLNAHQDPEILTGYEQYRIGGEVN